MSAAQSVELQRNLRAIETRYGARIGLTALDTGSGESVTYRAGERFAFASTNKLFIAAAVLRGSSPESLQTVVHYSRSDLLDYAPITSRHVRAGMTVQALIDAALRYSDNTAANLLVRRLHGVAAVQRFFDSLGDRTTRVDRIEPDLNTALPGDDRDTTTPTAFVRDLQTVLLGPTLPPAGRDLLVQTMRRNTTGGPYIRSGVPRGWTVADKTGAASFGTRNDIAVLYPPDHAPIVLVILTRRSAQDAPSEDDLIARTAEVAVRALRI